MHYPPPEDPSKTETAKSAQSQSAALCVLTQEINSLIKTERKVVSQWMSNIGDTLALPASLFTHRDGELNIRLEKTFEPDALRIARLIRNSFQLSVVPNNKVNLSIGIILYHNNNLPNQPDYMQKARDLAIKSFSSKRNPILFEDLSSRSQSAP